MTPPSQTFCLSFSETSYLINNVFTNFVRGSRELRWGNLTQCITTKLWLLLLLLLLVYQLTNLLTGGRTVPWAKIESLSIKLTSEAAYKMRRTMTKLNSTTTSPNSTWNCNCCYCVVCWCQCIFSGCSRCLWQLSAALC